MRKKHPRKSLGYRFWSRVNKNGPTMTHMDTPCWEWQGQTNNHGYGTIGSGGRGGKNILVHRLAYQLANNIDLIPNQHVCHECDNVICVNSKHLWLGNQQANMKDAIAKGRLKNPPALKGEENGHSILTESQVRYIRKRIAEGIKQTAVAKELDISKWVVWTIVHKTTWAWLD